MIMRNILYKLFKFLVLISQENILWKSDKDGLISYNSIIITISWKLTSQPPNATK